MFVRLYGWSTSREIREHEGWLFFEVAERGHCSICQSRINHVQRVVREKSLDVRYGHLLDRFPAGGRTLWIVLKKPQAEMSNEEIKSFIKDSLDLPIAM